MADLLTQDLTPTPAETLGQAPAEVKQDVPENGSEVEKDPIEGAADKLYGEQGENKNPSEKSGEETPEEKAAREEREKNETPEEKAAREAKEKEEAEKADERYGAPEGEYEAFSLPEGYAIDEAGAADINEVAKELNLSQASAQKLVDKVVAMRQREGEALEKVHTDWIEKSTSDKEFGGDKLKENLAVAQKALKEFGTPELGELLTGARLGNHPEVIRLLVRVGNRISEAPIVNGGKPVHSDPAKTLYPNLK